MNRRINPTEHIQAGVFLLDTIQHKKDGQFAIHFFPVKPNLSGKFITLHIVKIFIHKNRRNLPGIDLFQQFHRHFPGRCLIDNRTIYLKKRCRQRISLFCIFHKKISLSTHINFLDNFFFMFRVPKQRIGIIIQNRKRNFYYITIQYSFTKFYRSSKEFCYLSHQRGRKSVSSKSNYFFIYIIIILIIQHSLKIFFIDHRSLVFHSNPDHAAVCFNIRFLNINLYRTSPGCIFYSISQKIDKNLPEPLSIHIIFLMNWQVNDFLNRNIEP